MSMDILFLYLFHGFPQFFLQKAAELLRGATGHIPFTVYLCVVDIQHKHEILLCFRHPLNILILPAGLARRIEGGISLLIKGSRGVFRSRSSTSWQSMPVSMDFGFFMMSTNVAGLMPRATPNITNARTTFSSVEPPFIVTFRASRLRIASGLIMNLF